MVASNFVSTTLNGPSRQDNRPCFIKAMCAWAAGSLNRPRLPSLYDATQEPPCSRQGRFLQIITLVGSGLRPAFCCGEFARKYAQNSNSQKIGTYPVGLWAPSEQSSGKKLEHRGEKRPKKSYKDLDYLSSSR